MSDDLREQVARAIAQGLGDDFDHAFASKAEWTDTRGLKGGRFRDVNEPQQDDYREAADAALAAMQSHYKARELPDTLPGHWRGVEGREMAERCLTEKREELTYGHLTDMELANGVFMASRHDLDLIHWQTAAKERIRWLSAQLAALGATHAQG